MKEVELRCCNCGRKINSSTLKIGAGIRCPYCNSDRVVEIINRPKIFMRNFKRPHFVEEPKRFT